MRKGAERTLSLPLERVVTDPCGDAVRELPGKSGPRGRDGGERLVLPGSFMLLFLAPVRTRKSRLGATCGGGIGGNPRSVRAPSAGPRGGSVGDVFAGGE